MRLEARFDLILGNIRWLWFRRDGFLASIKFGRVPVSVKKVEISVSSVIGGWKSIDEFLVWATLVLFSVGF